MLKRISDFLAGWPMTILGGVFLAASFLLPRLGFPEGEKLAWVCVVVCGLPLLYLAIYRLIRNKGVSKISSCLLISMAMIAALVIGDLFAAGEVAFIMEIGALLEEMTTERAKKGLRNLIELAPETARVIKDGGERAVPVKEVCPGDLLRVLPGETVPVDGVISVGETSVDQSAMTGESLPVEKSPGDSVFSGTVNRFGSFDMEATKRGEDSSLQKLIRMVEDAEKNQAPTQRIADRWASWLVPVALLIAVGAYLITGELVRAVTVMVVFCPCALVLATPTAIMAAIGQAAKHGVIVKSGAALEAMGKVDTIALDKTGTLTCGRLEVSDILPLAGLGEKKLLALAASAEQRSEHPLGKAIAEKALAAGCPLVEAVDFRMTPGGGITASVGGKVYHFGNERLLREKGIGITPQTTEALERFRSEGKAVVIAADADRVVGLFALSDVLRPEARDVTNRLKQMGVRLVLLTGDNRDAAAFFAGQSGIETVRAELLPAEKLEAVAELKQKGKVCMIGDGVNDAPALKTADVGIAMGVMGSDLAVEAADIALMTDELSRLPYLKWLSDLTVRTIRIAITISMCINAAAIILSVTGILTPTSGALVHNAGSCLVVLLAALLYDQKYPQR